MLIAGVDVLMFVDSGASLNVTRVETMNNIVAEAKWPVQKLTSSSAPIMMAFAAERPLKCTYAIRTRIAAAENPEKKILTEFYAIDRADQDLLSYQTAANLNVILISYNNVHKALSAMKDSNLSEETQKPIANGPDTMKVFKVIGRPKLVRDESVEPFPKYPGFKLKLKFDQNIPPRFKNFDI